MKKRNFLVLLLNAMLILAACAFVRLHTLHQEHWEQEQSFETIRELRVPLGSPDMTGITAEPLTLHDTEQLKEQNPDYAAWIYISGTDVDYPVMQTPEEPERYLHKSFEGRENRYGVPFLDARCDLDQSGQLIVYGHNMADGAIFHSLEGYLQADFFMSRPVITLETPKEVRQYRIFASLKLPGTVADDQWNLLTCLDPSEAEWERLIEEVTKRKVCGAEVSPSYGRQLLTLITCDNAPGDERIAVLGIQK